MDTTKTIKTFEDALDFTGETIEQFNVRTANDSADEKAYKQLKVIVLALNGGETMDYRDVRVKKYYPWFWSAGSGSGFSYGDYYYVSASSTVGARLCLKSRELAIYAGKQFTEIYNQYINA